LDYREIEQVENSATKNKRVGKKQQKINVRNSGNGQRATEKMATENSTRINGPVGKRAAQSN